MGIKGLLPLLKEKNVVQTLVWPVEQIRLAIDVPIFACKFIFTCKSVFGLPQMFRDFAQKLPSTVTPVFVFDGEKIECKENECKKRAVARQKQHERDKLRDPLKDFDISDASFGILFPTRKDYETLFEDLSSSFECQRAKFEAEALCSYLVTQGQCWAALTEDTDALAFGCPRTIFKFFDEPVIVLLADVLSVLQWTESQFIDFCMLLGCDFCEKLKGIGPVGAQALLRKHESWSGIFADADNLSFAAKRAFQESYAKVHTLFSSACYESIPSQPGGPSCTSAEELTLD